MGVFQTILLLFLFNEVLGSLRILKIETRMPKPKDIGLIFDVTLENTDEECKELLSYRIRANGHCCVNVTPHIVMRKMGRVVGGDFGLIKPGAIDKVSLIWPTVSFYNRVGLCPIAVTSTDMNNKERTIRKMIKFDTRFHILDPYGQTLTKQKNFVDCQNWDKEYFRNCTPVNCEERYFGLRNFYNTTSEICEEVPRCYENYMLYDIYANECSDTRMILTEDDIKGFEEGRFDKNVWRFKFGRKKGKKKKKKKKKKRPHLFPNHDSKRYDLHHNEDDNDEENFQPQNDDNKGGTWMHGLGEGLLIVFATIVIYMLICFTIFLIVTWLSRRTSQRGNTSGRAIILNRRHYGPTEENAPIYTTSSLMSHR